MKKATLLLFLLVGFNSLATSSISVDNLDKSTVYSVENKIDKKKRINKKRKRKCQKWGRKSNAG